MQRHDGQQWLDLGEAQWRRTVCFGPAGFEAYARIRMIPDPQSPGQGEADAPGAEGAPGEGEQVTAALGFLLSRTAAQDVHLAVWDGWGADLGDLPGADEGWLRGVARRYRVCRQSRDDLLECGFGEPVPAFVWPEDRSWCFAFDVDPHWAGVGGSSGLIAGLLDLPGLDVVAADRDAEQPHYG